jgi:alpha-mannosidase
LLQGDGASVPTQAAAEGTWIDVGELAPYSVSSLVVGDGQPPIPDTGLVVTPSLLENVVLRVEFNQDGDITRIYDKANQREVLPAGALANQFQAFEDIPLFWDAWDVEIFYDDKCWVSDPATSVRVVQAGPLRATLEVQRRILNSDYVQRISLAYNQRRLDFDTFIQWQERRILLKVAFPVDILAPAATYEIQWGNVQRPTHRNTSWDWARFETCAQKWVDLSEGDYGVSLLNDCKYGHDVRDNVLRLTLLRSPIIPDPEADLGDHHFVYSLLPHSGGPNETTIASAYALNDPSILWFKEGGLSQVGDRRSGSMPASAHAPASAPLIACAEPNIVIETIKQAEDGQGIIVRFYESQRRRGMINLKAGFEIESAWRTNLLEENQAALAPNGPDLTLSVRPFEIVTLRLVPAG